MVGVRGCEGRGPQGSLVTLRPSTPPTRTSAPLAGRSALAQVPLGLRSPDLGLAPGPVQHRVS